MFGARQHSLKRQTCHSEKESLWAQRSRALSPLRFVICRHLRIHCCSWQRGRWSFLSSFCHVLLLWVHLDRKSVLSNAHPQTLRPLLPTR
jgi:hypothetical protein